MPLITSTTALNKLKWGGDRFNAGITDAESDKKQHRVPTTTFVPSSYVRRVGRNRDGQYQNKSYKKAKNKQFLFFGCNLVLVLIYIYYNTK